MSWGGDTFTPSTSGTPGAPPSRGADGPAQQEPVVRDKRRLDPETGQVRQPAPDAGAAAGPDAGAPAGDSAAADQAGQASVAPDAVSSQDGGAPCVPDADAPAVDELASALQLAAERLEDVQRLQAEYVNYRRRVERDRAVAREAGTTSVLEALLPVLDDIHLARQHGDLEGGPFAAIAEKLDLALSRAGLQRYGDVGEEFDPAVHEALMHSAADDVAVTTVTAVLQPGYRTTARVLRPARVAVTSPA